MSRASEALQAALSALAGDRAQALEALGEAVQRELDLEWSSRPAGPRLRAALDADADVARLIERVERAAGTDLSLLVLGPQGTARALVALAVHQASPRRRGPLIRLRGWEAPAEWARWAASAAGGSILIEEVLALPEASQEALAAALLATEEPDSPRLLATSRWDPAGLLHPDLDRALSVLRITLGPAPRLAGRAQGAAPTTLEEVEREAIAARLATHGWQQQLTADSLGIDRKTLYRKIRRYGLERPPTPEPGSDA